MWLLSLGSLISVVNTFIAQIYHNKVLTQCALSYPNYSRNVCHNMHNVHNAEIIVVNLVKCNSTHLVFTMNGYNVLAQIIVN